MKFVLNILAHMFQQYMQFSCNKIFLNDLNWSSFCNHPI